MSEIEYLRSESWRHRLLATKALSIFRYVEEYSEERIVRINGVIAITARYQTFPLRRRPLEKPPRNPRNNLYTDDNCKAIYEALHLGNGRHLLNRGIGWLPS